ncbi:MAG: BON domain-containing protein [Burkholderiaceae bacterium]
MNKDLGANGSNFTQRLTSLRRPLAAIALCCSAAVSLQGCVEMMVGGAVMGSLAATDRRTFGTQTEDKTIVFKGESRVSKLVGDAGHVNVNSFNRKVLLTGEVRDEATKQAVEREIAAVENVVSIINDLEVGMASSFASRSNDTLITGKVKASFVDAKDLFANSIKVVTERGNVYLMGIVTEREGARAAEVTSNVSGVQKVIKVFDYISEDELRRLSSTPEPQTRK